MYKHKNHDMILAYLEGKRIRKVGTQHEFQLCDGTSSYPVSIFNPVNTYEIVEDNPLRKLIPRQGQKVTTAEGRTYVLYYVGIDTMTLINIDWGTTLDGVYSRGFTYEHMQKRSGVSKFVKIVDINGKILFEQK